MDPVAYVMAWPASGANSTAHNPPAHRAQGKVLVRLREIAAGMSYLHSRNVLHGDLKVGGGRLGAGWDCSVWWAAVHADAR